MQNNIMESQNVEYKQSWRDEYLNNQYKCTGNVQNDASDGFKNLVFYERVSGVNRRKRQGFLLYSPLHLSPDANVQEMFIY